jgi:hypothetical protein
VRMAFIVYVLLYSQQYAYCKDYVLRLFILCIVLINVVNLLNQLNAHYYSHMYVTYIALACFGANAPSSGIMGCQI